MNLRKAKNNKKFIRIGFAVATIAVMIVPMLYSFIYLKSIWDVYSKIDKVPVAFVNLDKSITKDGEQYAVGKELENSLKDNKKLNWKFVSHEEAIKGVEGTEYYAVIEIPEDFSEKISKTKDGEFKNPEITYISNKGKNFVFSQVSSKVAESIKVEISSNIQKEVSKTLVDNLYDIKVSLKDAANGTEELKTGTEKLVDGGKKLVNGTQEAASGSIKLRSGLNEAAEVSGVLQAGTQKLMEGSSNLSNGLNESAIGSKKLLEGLKDITNGQKQIVGGTSSLTDGLSEFKKSLTTSNSRITELVEGASNISDNITLIKQGSEVLNTSLNTGLNALADGVNQSADGISQVAAIMNAELDSINNSNLSQEDKEMLMAAIAGINQLNDSNISANIEGPLREAATSVQPLVEGLTKLETGSKQVSDGVQQLATGLNDTQNKAAVALDTLILGANGIKSGSSSILEGLTTITEKTETLANGLELLNDGSITLKDGLKTVNEGNISLKNGLDNAAIKTGQLADGLRELSSGTISLSEGLGSANEGTSKLSDGLNDGYNEMNNNLKFTSKEMSDFISKPISIKDSPINDVEKYGEGLAPYFISMSLWLGAMLMGMIFSFAKLLNVFENKVMNSFLGKFILGSGLVSMQALILSFILLKGLDFEPVSIVGFYMSNVLISIVFFSISYGISHAFGIIASPIMFVILLLQLSSSGGTFPLETAPKFYEIVGKFIPMTYSIRTLRMVISGINTPLLEENIFVMVIFMALSLSMGLLIRALLNMLNKRRVTISNS